MRHGKTKLSPDLLALKQYEQRTYRLKCLDDRFHAGKFTEKNLREIEALSKIHPGAKVWVLQFPQVFEPNSPLVHRVYKPSNAIWVPAVSAIPKMSKQPSQKQPGRHQNRRVQKSKEMVHG